MPLQSLIDGFYAHLDQWQHGGLIAVLRDREPEPNLDEAFGGWEFKRGSDEASGTALRTLHHPQGQRPYVFHGTLDVPGESRRAGVATSLLAHEERAYRALGIERIELRAEKTGSYVWATRGFVIRVGQRKATPAEGQLEIARQLRGPSFAAALGKPLEEVEPELAALVASDPPHSGAPSRPSDLMAWPSGREILIRVLDWDGIKFL